MAKYFEEAPVGDAGALRDQVLAAADQLGDEVFAEYGRVVLGLGCDCSREDLLRELQRREPELALNFREEFEAFCSEVVDGD